MYEDPFYTIENENNRWFEESSLIPVNFQSCVQEIIYETVTTAMKIKKPSKSKALCSYHTEKSLANCEDLKIIRNQLINLKHQKDEIETTILATSLIHQVIQSAVYRFYFSSYESFESIHTRPQHTVDDDGQSNAVAKNSINTTSESNKYLSVDNAITAYPADMRRKNPIEDEKCRADIATKWNCSSLKDKQTIFKLLRAAIEEMRMKPKFVLAALPNSDQVPLLREWICARFNVQFDTKSRSLISTLAK
jgi:hypothetical protein